VCLSVAQRDALILLQREIDAAGGLQQAEQQQLQAVAWLLQQVPASSPAAAAEGLVAFLAALPAEGLIRLPAVSKDWLNRLLEAGVHNTFAQLLKAARRNVLGAKVWVQAQQQLGIDTDIPAAAIALCCDRSWASITSS
jgi:hypothetical protein